MQKSLFSFDEPMEPDLNRPEPAIWLKRVVLLEDAGAAKLIREPIEFHRGFNLIRTSPRLETDTSVIAHSVGKTLLMRLIRYSLGEENYASEETQQSLQMVLPTAHLVCQWSVAGHNWTVARPFHDHSHGASWCSQMDLWQSVFDEATERIPYGQFLDAVNQAVTDGLPIFENAKGQKPRWLDILGWLARDCECGYRKENEWRHSDMNLGKPSDLDFNRLLMQWLTGLMSAHEIQLRQEGWAQLGEKGKARRAAERLRRDSNVLEDSLRAAMDQPKPKPNGDEDSDPTFSPIAIVEMATESFQSKIDSLKSTYDLATMEKQISDLQKELDATKAESNKEAGVLSSKRSTMRMMQKSQDDTVDLNRCTASPCELRKLLDEEKKLGADVAKPQMTEIIREEIRASSDRKKRADADLEKLEEELKSTRSKYHESREEYLKKFGELERLKGQWESHRLSAQRYESVVKEAVQQEKQRDESETNEKETQTKLELERKSMNYTKKVTDFSNFYSQLLREIFEQDSKSVIGVDGNGIKVEPDKKLTPGGRALSAMAKVVTFDLACVAASMMGLGNHPRFLMHDSPREGEMETELFVKLFDLSCFLETVSDDGEPSFQYIVTTTTPPEKYEQDEEHVCISLHGRNEPGRLLKCTF